MTVRYSRRRMPWKAIGLAVVTSAGVLAWGAGLAEFAGSIPSRVVDADRRTDAIVVLTGGSERLTTGLRLLAEDKAQRVFVSGVHPGVDAERLLQLAGRPDDSLQGRIEIGYGALDTRGNARETAAWMHQHGYHSLRLVTGGYHMPRSLLEFEEALPEAEVVPHPVFPDRVKQASWWMRPGTAALIIGEYNKYLLARLRHEWQELAARMTGAGGTG